MGNLCSACFGDSRSESSDNFDQHPTERSRLLGADIIPQNEEPTPHNYHALSQLREQETLKRIVQRTADNLIDISSTRMLDRIQDEHAAQRAHEYSALVKECQPQLAKFTPKNTARIPSVEEAKDKIPRLLATGTIKREDIDQISEIMEQVKTAVLEMRVQQVGDIVVPMVVSV
ncbi:hypothetical protein SpCBS45565_g01557 [Spizellomyces sp. 'palustris']|nr:hypothetical protein SpCBS45565_g01557 [Spizellomyces sp. 'palustris']